MQNVNDWSLCKGDPLIVFSAGNAPKLESTTIHSVFEESEKTHIVVQTDIARKYLSPLVQRHKVDNIPLYTPSVYADIALLLGIYLPDRCQLSKQETLQKYVYKVKHKMPTLRDGIATGDTARFNRAVVYHMIRVLARFRNDYHAIDEVVLNSKTFKASSKLTFGSVKRGGDFHTHIAKIDADTRSCGLLMNYNDSTDLDIDASMNYS